jgi:hypothetical protein
MFSNSSIAVRFGLTQRSNIILLILNLVGALLYIWRSSFSWAIPQEKGLNSTTGEPFIWAIAILPVLAVALLVNVPWGGDDSQAKAMEQWTSMVICGGRLAHRYRYRFCAPLNTRMTAAVIDTTDSAACAFGIAPSNGNNFQL